MANSARSRKRRLKSAGMRHFAMACSVAPDGSLVLLAPPHRRVVLTAREVQFIQALNDGSREDRIDLAAGIRSVMQRKDADFSQRLASGPLPSGPA